MRFLRHSLTVLLACAMVLAGMTGLARALSQAQAFVAMGPSASPRPPAHRTTPEAAAHHAGSHHGESGERDCGSGGGRILGTDCAQMCLGLAILPTPEILVVRVAPVVYADEVSVREGRRPLTEPHPPRRPVG